MVHANKTEVLIVGAGPVGLSTALRLVRNGVRPTIIDQEERTASQSYACVIHSRSLAAFDRIGIASQLINAGHSIATIAYYSAAKRECDLQVWQSTSDFPHLIVVPQSVLEHILETELQNQGIHVNWSCRLNRLHQNGEKVVATIDQFCRSAKGYVIPRMEWEVKSTLEYTADYVVGADGASSMVRRCNNIAFNPLERAETFAIFEIECDHQLDREVRILLDGVSCNAVWPLDDHHCRWTLQLPDDETPLDHSKDRAHLHLINPSADAAALKAITRFVRKKAPWFDFPISSVEWSSVVQFQSSLAESYGSGRCWLAGDAAHQMNPIGMQSMNVGLAEGAQLADILISILRAKAPKTLLNFYEERFTKECLQLFHRSTISSPGSIADPWLARNGTRLVRTLPAAGRDLLDLITQLESARPFSRA